MSNDSISHPIEAAHCTISILASFDMVGLSRGISYTRGSSYPSTTNLALGTCLESLGPGESTGFHVRIHLHRRMFSSGIWCLNTLATVSVASQLSISFILAWWNIWRSVSLSWDIFTSLLCFLAADTKNDMACGSASRRHLSMSAWLMSTSSFQTWSSDKWKHSLRSSNQLHCSTMRPSSSSSGIGVCTGAAIVSADNGGKLSDLIWGNWFGWLLDESSPPSGVTLPGVASGSGSLWISLESSWMLMAVRVVGLKGMLLSGVITWLLRLWSCVTPWGGMILWVPWCVLLPWSLETCWFWFHSSTADRGRMCSGAARYNLVPLVTQTTLFPSWIITFIGPSHWPLASPLCFHNMTHSPAAYCPRLGRLLPWSALLRVWSLSTAAKARRALSRHSSSARKRNPSAVGRKANSWAADSSSLMTDAGDFVLFPKTSISGGYPRYLLPLILGHSSLH